MPAKTTFKTAILFGLLTAIVVGRCSFRINPDNVPVKVDTEPFMVSGLTQCTEYNGRLGCCNEINDAQQSESYTQIDGVFGAVGGGCDICAVNLKRFWCEYACSPNQASFASVADGYTPYPSPTNPDKMIQAQVVTLTIEAQTACDLYSSCSRNGFVASVSAMSTPAGFMAFQGRNALDEAAQYIKVDFSYDKTKALTFSADSTEETTKEVTSCESDIKNGTLHGFPVKPESCVCNNCGAKCHDDSGFVYTEPKVLEDFNYILVGATWAVTLAITITVTTLRKRSIL